MAYDKRLAERVKALLNGHQGLIEKKMFGGLAHLSNGKMFAGILHKDLVVRVGPENNDGALKEPHTRPMDFTGKPMKGYIYVEPGGVKTDSQLYAWLTKGLAFVTTLPPTKRKPAGSTFTTVHRSKKTTS